MPSQPAVSGSGFASQPLSPMAIWGGRSRSDGKSQVPGLLLVEANGGILPGVGRKGWSCLCKPGKWRNCVTIPRTLSPRHCLLDLHDCIAILARYAIHDVTPDTIPYYDLLYQWTASLVEQHWRLVEVVAQALLERSKLSGAQIREVIRTTAINHKGRD
jgi:hypothetical protein